MKQMMLEFYQILVIAEYEYFLLICLMVIFELELEAIVFESIKFVKNISQVEAMKWQQAQWFTIKKK